MLSRRLLLFSCAIALVILPCAFAQENTTGLEGVVKDPSGAVVPRASVEVSGPALLGVRKVTTDSSGSYHITAIPPGTYTLTVVATGFRTYKQTGIELGVGRLPNIDVQLLVGAVAETVEVSSRAPVVDVTQSKVATTVEKEVLEDIPKGRSFQSVIQFAPGARQEPLQGTTNGFQIDGASDSENVYLIDGVNTTNIQNGGVGKAFQMDFVQEVQVKTSSFEAEYGGALGGVINVVPARGSNAVHGDIMTYLQSNKWNANNTDRQLGTDPTLPGLNTNVSGACIAAGNCRLDATPRYYFGVKDDHTILEPGFRVGAPIIKDKLWIFASYIPDLDTTWRTTTFIGANPGPRRLSQTFTQHNSYDRLDYAPLNTLRLYASWNYGYSRTQGTLGAQDSAAGQRPTATALTTGSTTDPNTLRADAGSVNPLSVFAYGADWTPTSRLVVSARYGYFFNNNEQRGIPSGLRYQYNNTAGPTTKDITGAVLPAAYQNASGYSNIGSNLAYVYDAYKRDGINVDVSYFIRAAGTHNFKTGFFMQRQSNAVLRNYNGGYVTINWAQSYAPVTSNTACDGIIAQNVSAYGSTAANAAGCQGKYGYFTIGNNVTNTGEDHQTAKAFYFQDSWNVGRGLTLNLGLRFDQETQPPYDPSRFPTVDFGWGDKIAPRLGGAYDLLHNGKVKIYASYGQFYDIMKMGLARGSFGSDYWHNCVYALDDPDYTKITPTYPQGGGCPASGPAPGVTVGRFIENVDFRATKADPRDPAISPTMKPMKQHEVVIGADWAINRNWALTSRYSRKRLDLTIEDMAITDNLGFYIGNPGSQFADVLHRPTVIPGADGVTQYLNNTPFCAECPAVQPAVRNYDSLEFRLLRTGSDKWFTAITYSYSNLRGNYAGLTNTDPTDGGGGRHAPDNGRAFDIPTMTYTPSGQPDYGPLSTDRPNTASIYGSYKMKWHLFSETPMSTTWGLQQIMYQGTPIDSCLPVVGTSSACQWASGRGNFMQLTRTATGDITSSGVVNDARTDNLLQTDINLMHTIPVKGHDKMNVTVEMNVFNVFNQRAGVNYYEFMIPSGLVTPTRASRFPGDPQIDWNKVMTAYNVLDALNGTGSFAGVQSKLTLASRYGLPQAFQTARNLRLAVRFTF
jgi:hypothetical protein